MPALIPLFDYNLTLSLLDFLSSSIANYTVNNKNIAVVSSYADISSPYKMPALAMEILYRKNRSIGLGNIYGEKYIVNAVKPDNIIEFEGALFEYRIQMNVYSNTRGENLQWSSIVDEVLKIGERGIMIHTYDSKGIILQASVGNIDYVYSRDVKNNPMNPNIVTYDYHTIFEIKATALQNYAITYSAMELGKIIGQIKR